MARGPPVSLGARRGPERGRGAPGEGPIPGGLHPTHPHPRPVRGGAQELDETARGAEARGGFRGCIQRVRPTASL